MKKSDNLKNIDPNKLYRMMPKKEADKIMKDKKKPQKNIKKK